MNCPKCGVVAAAGAEECAACGIVFSRWRERPLRTSPPPVEGHQRIPTPLIIAGAIVFILIGLIWTAHRRSARASEKSDMSAMLDDINNKGKAERDRLRDEAEKGYRAAQHDQAVASAAAANAARQLPPTITEADLRTLIEQDVFFQEHVLVSVPKSFSSREYASVARQYPALTGAIREGLIEFDPPFDPKAPGRTDRQIYVHVPPLALYKVPTINDRPDTYELDLGRRRLADVTIENAADFAIAAAFTYDYEQSVGSALLDVKRVGHASLKRAADGWRLDSLTHQ
ncbi:MAG TPA: hypothetical protein VGJ82_10090 [Thermoanaerobaculia bacterium]|jgi:hypothetical protein